MEVIPYLQNKIWSREINNLNQAHQNLRHFINSAVQIEELLKQYTLSMTEAVEKINFRVSQIEAETSVEKTRNLMNTLNSNLRKSSQTIGKHSAFSIQHSAFRCMNIFKKLLRLAEEIFL